MTDEFNALTVILERDIREDDAQSLIDAIMMLKGVCSVKGNVSDTDSYIAERRVKWELIDKLWEVLK